MTYMIEIDNKKFAVEVDGDKVNLVEKSNEAKLNQHIELQDSLPDFDFNDEHFEQKTIKSVMPGRIVDICVNQQQLVKEGEVLAKLESMKMEMDIIAPMSVRIDSLLINIGDNVKKDQDLFVIA